MSSVLQRTFGAILVALTLSPILLAQSPNTVPQAPVPAQIGAARRVFVSYAGGVGGYIPRDDQVYDQIYAEMKNWGRFELLSAPAEADLVLEVSVPMAVGYPRLRMAVLDPKTQVVLWSFTEQVKLHGGFHNGLNGRLGFGEATTKIVDDFKKLDARAKTTAERAEK
jgi:hypothetical protein